MGAPVIFGLKGVSLTPEERAFFRDIDPWGFIVFRRNLETREQVRALTVSLRDLAGRDVPILVDHEGGRVSRLSPHLVPKRPPAQVFEKIAARHGLNAAIEAARLGGEILARDAYGLGIDVNCVPMVDVRDPCADDIIGDRAVGEAPDQVAVLGRAIADGTLAGGCLPVVKHIPGHGRAQSDSHHELPRVSAGAGDLCTVDFAPFRALADLPLGMTAHIVYDAYDDTLPATLSPGLIQTVIRGHIGFDGLLMTDDLSMKALSGSFAERAQRSLDAGCDLVLHCNGEMEEMRGVADGLLPMTAAAMARSDRALAMRRRPAEVDEQNLNARFALLTNADSVS